MAPFEFSKEHLPTELFINNDSMNLYPPMLARSSPSPIPKMDLLCPIKFLLPRRKALKMPLGVRKLPCKHGKNTKSVYRRALMLRFADLIEENIEILSELTRLTLGAPHETWGKHEIAIAVEVCLPRACADRALIHRANKNRHSGTTPKE